MAKKVNIRELARRYTTAIFALAKSGGNLSQLATDLQILENLLDADANFKKLLASPVLSQDRQLEIIREVAKAAKFSTLTLNFLLIIVRNGRLEYLKQITSAFRERIAKEQGELQAEITVAQKLDATQLAAIEKDLSAKTGKKIRLAENIRPEIIGGLVVKIGAKMFDYSIRSRLNRLKNRLNQAS